MIETRHPDVYIIERPAQPRIVGVGTSTGALVGFSERGPTDKADLVTSFSQFITKYGSYFKGSSLPHAVKGFFDQGGARLFIVRVVGSGSALSDEDFENMGSADVAASVTGTVDLSGTLDLSDKKYISLDVDDAGAVDIDLSSTAGDASAVTLAEIISAINGAGFGAVASAGLGDVLVISSLTTGPGSEVELASPTGVADFAATYLGTGFDGTALNDGNKELLLNMNGLGDVTVDLSGVAGFVGAGPSTVVVADVVSAINTQLNAAYANAIVYASVDGGEVRLTSDILGPTSSIKIGGGLAGTNARLEVFGLTEGSGDLTIAGDTSDAITEVLGLAEGTSGSPVTYTFTGSTSSTDFMNISAINVGEWGNDLTVTTQRWESTTAEILGIAAEEVAIGSIRDAKIGDIVEIDDGVTKIVRHVNEIDSALKKIKFVGSPNPGPALASGATVKCSTSHRLVTELVDPIVAGDTTATLLSAAAITEGVRLVLDDKGSNPIIEVVVKSVNGSLITFDPVPSDVDADAIVSTQHFDLLIKEEGEVVEVHSFLSAEDTDVKDFFETRLSGDANESKIIVAEALAVTTPGVLLSNPSPVKDIFLSGGLDGTTPTPLDYLGSEISPRTGMHLLEDNDEFVMFSFPGITDVFTVRSAIAFAERLGRVMFISETPLSDDEPLEALAYRTAELAIDSSYAALYYPWIKVRDPGSANPEAIVTIPPSGHIQGIWSRVAQTVGIHKAPAGVIDGNLGTVFGLTYEITDGEQDLLNPEGVNAIRFFRGQGFKVWGARTLWRNPDGFHYISTRRLINFVKESIRRGNRFAVFEPNDPALWDRITIANTEFLTNLWQRGMLFPTNNLGQSFFFQCDAETNPLSEIKRGRVNAKVGINPPFPAEFVIFTIGLFDGGGDISEGFGIST